MAKPSRKTIYGINSTGLRNPEQSDFFPYGGLDPYRLIGKYSVN